MRKEMYICDLCGCELDSLKLHHLETNELKRGLVYNSYETKRFDVCKHCLDEFGKWVVSRHGSR